MDEILNFWEDMGADILQKEGGGRCDHKAPKKA